MEGMNVFLIHAGDDDFSRELPGKLDRSPRGPQRVKLMAFPPPGIQTLAPVLRQHGHQVRMFDTCHPEMKPEHLAHAVSQQRPDVIAISFLSTTTYPAAKSVAASPNGNFSSAGAVKDGWIRARRTNWGS
jgi:anaerobic magnesium-protoporphyrin IX monomethyl ester cyclase